MADSKHTTIAPAERHAPPITPQEYVAILEAGGIRAFAWRGGCILDLRRQRPVPTGQARDCALYKANAACAAHPDRRAFDRALIDYLTATGRVA